MSTPNAHEYPHNNNDLPTCYKKKSTWFQYVHANLNRTKRNERKKAAAAAATATGPQLQQQQQYYTRHDTKCYIENK